MLPKAQAMKAKRVGAVAPKAMKAAPKAMKAAMELKKSVASKILNFLAEVGTKEVVRVGKFTLPGLARIQTKLKPARKAGMKMMFGKEVMVKAQPAKTVVKAFPVAALKK